MTFGFFRDDERLRPVLRKDERVVAEAKRNLAPMWIAFALVGMALIAYGLQDPVFGWGTFFLGSVAMSMVGGAITGTRTVVTDGRIVQTGTMGLKVVGLAEARVSRAKTAFGDTLTIEGGDVRIRARHLKNADEVVRALGDRAVVQA